MDNNLDQKKLLITHALANCSDIYVDIIVRLSKDEYKSIREEITKIYNRTRNLLLDNKILDSTNSLIEISDIYTQGAIEMIISYKNMVINTAMNDKSFIDLLSDENDPLDPIKLFKKYKSLEEFYDSDDFRANILYWRDSDNENAPELNLLEWLFRTYKNEKKSIEIGENMKKVLDIYKENI